MQLLSVLLIALYCRIIRSMRVISFCAMSAVLLLCISARAHAGREPDFGRGGGNMSTEIATFAGGCFWCIQSVYEGRPGIMSAVSGYTGGEKSDPTYEDVSGGRTGHVEAVQITFDPTVVSYDTLLDEFWKNIDPTQTDGQFADRGPQYRTAIFFHTEQQQKAAETSKEELDASGRFSRPIAVEIRPASAFYPAEDYHQSYASKNPREYRSYREGSGRGPFVRKAWGSVEDHH